MKFIALLLILSTSGFASVKVSYDLCNSGGDQYRLSIDDQHVRIIKNDALLVDDTYTDLHVADARELSEIQHGFVIYLGIKDVRSAISASVTTSGETRHFLLGERAGGQAAMVLNASEVGVTELCR